MLEVRIVAYGAGEVSTRKELREPSGVLGMFYTLICVMVK